HEAGVCNPATGACSSPAKPDGAACDDGDACTRSDTCQAGVCMGHEPVVCSAGDQCHEAGVCDPATGTCSSPAKPDGTACDDGNPCTRRASCEAGICTGDDPVVCHGKGRDHTEGVCDPGTGRCSNPNSSNRKADRTVCNDHGAHMRNGTCRAPRRRQLGH